MTGVNFYAFVYRCGDDVEEIYHNIWNGVPDECLLRCNQLLTRRFFSVFGPMELNFSVYTESVTATLELKLLALKHEGILAGHSEIEVFGSATSWTQTIADERAKICMFKRDKDMCALVKPGKTIPLSRSLTVCPLRSSTAFHLLSLYHPSSNEFGDEVDYLIVNHDVETPATQKEEMTVLESDCASIQLKVTFTDWLGQPHGRCD